ncbi:MAG TPA: MFS transporter [Actinomycetes bacterium]|nr:MFS transporter [Actinomycetes bacterium]
MDQAGRGPAESGRRRWVGLFFVALGVALIIVDATIVNVAVPSIIRDLGITSTDAQWVQEAYTLVFAALLLTAGRLADRWGRRALFEVGVVVFMVSSILAARSGTGNELIMARVAQGVGGAMMLPTSLSIINAGFRGRSRAIAFAVWGSTIGGTAALGPLLGGWLTTSYSWRWAFGINVPLGLVVLVGTWLAVDESRGDDPSPGVDVGGALLSIVGFGAIVFGLIEGRTYGWWSREKPFSILHRPWQWQLSPIPVAFAVGVLALLAFVGLERRRNRAGKVVLLDLGLFSIPSFRGGNIAAGIVSLGEFGLLFSLPLWFQNVRGYTAFETGLALLPLAVGSFVASGFGGQLALRRGAPYVVRLGILLEVIGVAGIGVVVSPSTPWTLTSPLLFVYGMGVGLATAQLTGVVLTDVPVVKSGQGSGTTSTTRQLGSALGIAILGTVLFTSLGLSLDRALARQGQLSADQRRQVVAAVRDSAGAAIGGLAADPRTESVAEDARTAFSHATRNAAWAAAGFLLLGLYASRGLGSPTTRAEAAEEVAARP